jgi:hypothetical protein
MNAKQLVVLAAAAVIAIGATAVTLRTDRTSVV